MSSGSTVGLASAPSCPCAARASARTRSSVGGVSGSADVTVRAHAAQRARRPSPGTRARWRAAARCGRDRAAAGRSRCTSGVGATRGRICCSTARFCSRLEHRVLQRLAQLGRVRPHGGEVRPARAPAPRSGPRRRRSEQGARVAARDGSAERRHQTVLRGVPGWRAGRGRRAAVRAVARDVGDEAVDQALLVGGAEVGAHHALGDLDGGARGHLGGAGASASLTCWSIMNVVSSRMRRARSSAAAIEARLLGLRLLLRRPRRCRRSRAPARPAASPASPGAPAAAARTSAAAASSVLSCSWRASSALLTGPRPAN